MAKMKIEPEKLGKDEPQDWDDFVRYATGRAFDGLIRQGTQGMKGELYGILMYFVNWHRKLLAQRKEEERARKVRR